MTNKSITINRRMAKDASPVALFVQTASKYDSRILVLCGNKTVNAKSIMGVMTLDLSNGSKLDIQAEGSDEQEAIAGIMTLLCK